MLDLDNNLDVRLLVQWLGSEGAKAGLVKSKKCTINVLKDISSKLQIETPSKPKRYELIDDIVKVAGKRIEKSLDELYQMEQDELTRYFEQTQVEHHELLDLLKDLDLDPGREGRRNLLEFVARELAETGRFMRIASPGNNRDE